MNERLTGDDMAQIIRWQISMPIFKNPVILRQLAVALGIPIGLVALIIGLSSGKGTDTLYALGLIVVVLVLAWLFIMAAYQGKYEAEFILDNKGALFRTQAKQAKKNRVINTLTVVLGLFTGRSAVAGAGLLGTVTAGGSYPVEPCYKDKIQAQKSRHPAARRLDGADRTVLHTR